MMQVNVKGRLNRTKNHEETQALQKLSLFSSRKVRSGYCNCDDIYLGQFGSLDDCQAKVESWKTPLDEKRYFIYADSGGRSKKGKCYVQLTTVDCPEGKRPSTWYDFYEIDSGNPIPDTKMRQMWKLGANMVYKTNPSNLGKWKLLHNYDASGDKVTLHRHEDSRECVIAFSGSDDIQDWMADANVAKESACGYEMHRGFFRETRRVVSDSGFVAAQNYLKDRNECSSVATAGHSLGGAIASILAGCAAAESQDLGRTLGFDVQDIWTYAAARPATTPIENSVGGCFGGARFFNYDDKAKDGSAGDEGRYDLGPLDPVPVLLDGSHAHPKVPAYQLFYDKSGNGDLNMVLVDADCTSQRTTNSPATSNFGFIASTDLSHHYGDTYGTRLEYCQV